MSETPNDEAEIEDANDNVEDDVGEEIPINNAPVEIFPEEIARKLDMVANPCCTKLCLNGLPYPLMVRTMTDMAMLSEQQRVRLLLRQHPSLRRSWREGENVKRKQLQLQLNMA